MEPHRCPWARGENYIQYHDTEWGVPIHDDRLLFEFLVLEFVGSTICYAFMQAVGMVDDHLVSCFRYLPRRKAG